MTFYRRMTDEEIDREIKRRMGELASWEVRGEPDPMVVSRQRWEAFFDEQAERHNALSDGHA